MLSFATSTNSIPQNLPGGVSDYIQFSKRTKERPTPLPL
jgi:hypothetical protein